jgi:opacity protein-like surface antigen
VKRCLILFVTVIILATGMAFAQTSGDVSGNLTGIYGNSTSGNGVLQSPTNSAGVLVSGRFNFGRFSAVEANYGYTKNSQQYLDLFGNFTEVQAGVHEVTGAYVLRYGYGPVRPFLLAGGGVLIFDPTSANVLPFSASRQTKAAFLYGGGADFNINRLVAVRAQVRGLVYGAPSFGQSALDTGSTERTVEPSIGLVFKF